MRLADLVYAPWAITPEMHAEVMSIYARHLRGEKINLKAVEAAIGKPLKNEQAPYEITNGVAVLPIEGVIAKRMSLFSKISGGASSSYVGQQFAMALEDPAVKAIILNIDSPGGAVDGTQELCALIAGARGTKPCVAFTDGTMASAAYWIGSAADEIYISGDTTMVGSIGVIMTHVDRSAQEADWGMKTTVITAGKYKAVAHEHAPLTDEGLGVLQGMVDAIYEAFVDDVAANRGTDPETVLNDMADGRVFVGDSAIAAGLVDGVSTLDDLIAKLAQEGASPSFNSAGAALNPKPKKEIQVEITKEYILAEHPQIAEALRAEGRAEGADRERARIQDVLKAGLPGHTKLMTELAFDGKTTAPEAAMICVQTENKLRAGATSAIETEAPKPVVHAAAPMKTNAAPAANEGLPLQDRCKAIWDQDPAVRDEFITFESYVAFERANDSGQIKVQERK